MTTATGQPAVRPEGAGRDDYSEWKGWSRADFGRVTPAQRRYFGWQLARARVPAGARVLELGFGNGAFLGFCRERGLAAVGVESNPNLVAWARAAGFTAAQAVEELPPEARYDLVALFDVLEHVPQADLVPFVSRLAARMAPGGAILVRVPNGDSPFGRVHQHGDLTHVTAFGESKLRQLAGRCGLVLASIGEAPWHAQPVGRRTPRALLRGILRWGISRLFGFAFFNRRIDLSANLSAVLRRADPGPSLIDRGTS